MPILWLFLGPPIFRFTEQSALDSLALNFDGWIVLRALWWLFFGFVALRDVYRFRYEVRPFLRSLGMFPWLVGIWLATLFVSSVSSPSPVFSIGNAGFMTILVAAALDLALKLRTGLVQVGQLLDATLRFSLVLVGAYFMAFLLDPGLVGADGGFGSRARGGQVTDIALVAQIIFFVGIYRTYRSQGPRRFAYVALAIVSPLLLLSAQTRAMYLAFAAASTVFFASWLAVVDRRVRLQTVGVLLVVISSILGIEAYGEISREYGLATTVEEVILRGDPESLRDWNGRAGLALILLDRLSSRPWGLGYSAGPRDVLLNAPFAELQRYGIYERFAGNAHNVYLEVLAGGGFVSAAAYLLLLVWLTFRLWRLRTLYAAPARALFVVVLIGGLTESMGVLPFFQASALLWILAAVIAGNVGAAAPGPALQDAERRSAAAVPA